MAVAAFVGGTSPSERGAGGSLYALSMKQLYAQVIADVRDGKAGTIHPELYRAYSENLTKGVSGVFSPSAYGDRYSDMQNQFEANAARFAAYKAFHATQQLQRQLADSDGVARSPEEFDRMARAVLNTFNRYQAAEYNTAVARARTAKQWADFSQGDNMFLFPNIRWLPSRSANPREQHMPFYNRVWAKNDPFWTVNQPGNLWNCKCDWEETDDPVTGDNPEGLKPAKGLEGNPAETGQIFTDQCTYIQKAGKTGYGEVEEFFRPIAEHHQQYIALRDDPDYNDVKFDWGNGGLKGTHIRHEVHTAEKEETFFKELTKDGKGLTSTQLEQSCQNILFGLGNSAVLCEEGIKNANGGVDTSLDLLLNGKRMDIASITELKGYYMYPVARKNHQLGKYNNLDYITDPSDSVCLYFHDPSMYSPEKVMKGFEEFKKQEYEDKVTGERKRHTIRIKHIYCVINEGNGKGRKEVFDVE